MEAAVAMKNEAESSDPLCRTDTVQPSYERMRNGFRVRHLRGFDREAGRFPVRVADQCRLALSAGNAALSEKGASLEDVVHVTYLVKEAGQLSTCGSFIRDMLGDNRPATTVLVVRQFDRSDVEIEVEMVARMPEASLPV